MSLAPGTVIGPYEIVGKIGEGGMGEVYRARDTRLEREVALKILPPHQAADPERAARFDREARAVAALRHPNIVTIHAVGEESGVPYIAMELVEGRTLTDLIPQGGFALNGFLDIAIPLSGALAAAHAKGITHRDLKPDNVMVEPDGHVKVLDFGLAKLLQTGFVSDATQVAGARPTQEGHILGTVAYMSPEQAEGKPVDPRSDVFSLGIVLYEMITGERPFRGDTQISTLTSILRDTPPPVHERKHTAPRQLDRILQRCLEKAPDRRYETARGLRNDLESLRTEVTSQPRITNEEASAAPRTPRSVLPAWTWVAGLALVLALGTTWWVLSDRKTDAPSAPTATATATTAKPSMIVVFPFENLGSADDKYFAAGISDEITSRLSAVKGLSVLSRNSAVQYDRTGKTMQKIADELGVDYVLDGTVRWAKGGSGASQVRITPQLIRAREDRQLWSTSYDRSMDEIFKIQTDIANEVVDKLGTTLAPQERDALATAPTTNVGAYHAFLRGVELADDISFRREEFDKAATQLEEACAKDPKFLRAWAELAKLHAGYIHFVWDTSAERLAKSKAAIDRALAIDPESPWTQLGLGYYHYWGRKDYDSANAAFAKARTGLPSNADAVGAQAYVLRRQGKFEEAATGMEKACILDPRNRLMFFTRAETLLILRRYDEARLSIERAIALSPETATGYGLLSRIELMAGNVDASRAAFSKAPDIRSSESRVIRVWVAIGFGNFDLALEAANAVPDAESAQFFFQCRPQLRGWALKLRGDAKGSRAEFERARVVLEDYIRTHPDEANVRSALGDVLAHLGRPDDAIREARAALTMPPVTTDQWVRQYRLFDLAIVEMNAGQHDAAIEHLGELLSQPSDQVSVEQLRLSPLFDPLRKEEGFGRLVGEGR